MAKKGPSKKYINKLAKDKGLPKPKRKKPSGIKHQTVFHDNQRDRPKKVTPKKFPKLSKKRRKQIVRKRIKKQRRAGYSYNRKPQGHYNRRGINQYSHHMRPFYPNALENMWQSDSESLAQTELAKLNTNVRHLPIPQTPVSYRQMRELTRLTGFLDMMDTIDWYYNNATWHFERDTSTGHDNVGINNKYGNAVKGLERKIVQPLIQNRRSFKRMYNIAKELADLLDEFHGDWQTVMYIS